MLSLQASKFTHNITRLFEASPLSPSQSPLPEINLSAGDPTARHFEFCDIRTDAIKQMLLDPATYHRSESKELVAKQRIAAIHSSKEYAFNADEVFITQGGYDWPNKRNRPYICSENPV